MTETFEQVVKITLEAVFFKLLKKHCILPEGSNSSGNPDSNSLGASDLKSALWNEAVIIVLQAICPNSEFDYVSHQDWAKYIELEMTNLSESGMGFAYAKTILKERMRRLICAQDGTSSSAFSRARSWEKPQNLGKMKKQKLVRKRNRDEMQ